VRTLVYWVVLLGAIAPHAVFGPEIVDWAAAADAGDDVSNSSRRAPDQTAIDEMLRGAKRRMQYWTAAPQLVVLVSVMEYRGTGGAESVATAELMSDAEAEALQTDLTAALNLLTDGTYRQFAAIRREVVPIGERTRLSRPRQIVVGRYSGLRRLQSTIGFGGRAARVDGRIVGGAILLDSDYDHTSDLRRLLRMHELGHALGYNHVHSQPSIMNPEIGSELTLFDRMAIRAAFDRPHTTTVN
jgi:hypothetical protein